MLGLFLRLLPFIVIVLVCIIKTSIKKINHNKRLEEVRERNAQRVRENIRRARYHQDQRERESRWRDIEERYREQERNSTWRDIEARLRGRVDGIQGSMRIENVVPNRPDLGQRQYVFRNDVWELERTTTPTNEFLTEKDMEIE